MTTENRVEYITLDAIRIDGGTQARAGLNEETVAEYAATWQDLSYQQNGLDRMPPIVLYHDGESYWLADGFHRVAAYKRFLTDGKPSASPRALRAEVHQGTRRDAVLHACGANAAHGLRRTNADKRRAVETLLRDEEWRQWSDRKIAEACAVDHKTVATARAEMEATGEIPQLTERQGADGKVRPAARLGPGQPAPAPWPYAPEGWRWRRNGGVCQLIAPDGWATANYNYPERALAEAQRRIISQPKPAPIVTDADEPSDEEFNETVRAFAQHGHRLLRNGDRYTLFPPEDKPGIANMQWHAVAARLGVLERQALEHQVSEPPKAEPFWQSMSDKHPTAHLWMQAGMYSYRSACGMTAQRQPSGSTEAGHCSSCVRATWPQNVVGQRDDPNKPDPKEPPAPTQVERPPMPDDLRAAGYRWFVAGAGELAIHSADGWQGDAPTPAGMIHLARDRMDAQRAEGKPSDDGPKTDAGRVSGVRRYLDEQRKRGHVYDQATFDHAFDLAREIVDGDTWRAMIKEIHDATNSGKGMPLAAPAAAQSDRFRDDPAHVERIEEQIETDRVLDDTRPLDWNAIARESYRLGATTRSGEAWVCLSNIVRILSASDMPSAIIWLMTEASALAPDDLTALADQLDDATYEALAAWRRDRNVPTLESEGIV